MKNKRTRKEPQPNEVNFYFDSELICVDEKDFLHFEGDLFFDNGSVTECVVKIPKLDFLFLQSQFFDAKRKCFLQHKDEEGDIQKYASTAYIAAGLFKFVGDMMLIDEESFDYEESEGDDMYFDNELKENLEDHIKFVYCVEVKKCEIIFE